MTLITTLLVVGAILMFPETALPEMVSGIVGSLSLLAAVILGFQEFGYLTGSLILGAVLVGLVMGTLCWLEYLPESRVARLYISRRAVGELGVARPGLLNCTGVAITPLRPSGTAFINGKRVDVISEGGLIERDAPLRVVAVEGLRVVVRATARPADSLASAPGHSPDQRSL